jgi:hypothetical protein
MLSVANNSIVLSVVMQNVVMLNVVAPLYYCKATKGRDDVSLDLTAKNRQRP